MYFKTIPIVSNTTSLPEVVGEAGLLADPNNAQEIADQMWLASNMTTIQKRNFRKAAREQIKKFSWKQSTQTILTTILNTASQLKQQAENEDK